MCKLASFTVCQLLVSICTSHLYLCAILLYHCLINQFQLCQLFLHTPCVSYLYPECKFSVLACQLFVPICVTHLYRCVIHQSKSASNLYKLLAVCNKIFPVCKPFVSFCPIVPMCNLAVPIFKLSVLVCQRFVPQFGNHLPTCNFSVPMGHPSISIVPSICTNVSAISYLCISYRYWQI
jgi:hypothetical protein